MPPPFPPEILALIFTKYFRSDQQDAKYSDYKYSRLRLLTLTSVCQNWRGVACTTPELWTACWLSYSHPEFNILWLSRTGTRLFDIYTSPSLHFEPDYHGLRGATLPLQRVLLKLSSFMQRCRSLFINACIRLDDPKRWISAPNLVSCEITNGDIPLWLWQTLYHAPKLQELNVNDYSELIFPTLANLTALTISCSAEEPVALGTILTNAPKLRTLHVEDSLLLAKDDLVLMGPTPIVHQTLSDLSLHFFGEDVELVFGHLTLPSLRVLTLGEDLDTHGFEGWSETQPPAFYAFLERSVCEIEAFTTRTMDSQSLTSLLKHRSMSTLRRLEFGANRDFTPQLLSFLADAINIPDLQELELSWVVPPTDSQPFTLLSDILVARRAPVDGQIRVTGSQLIYFYLSFDGTFWNRNHLALEPEYTLLAERIRAIAKSSASERDTLVVDLEKWPSLQDSLLMDSDEERSSGL